MASAVECGSVIGTILQSAKIVFVHMLCVGVDEEVVTVRIVNTCVRKGLDELR